MPKLDIEIKFEPEIIITVFGETVGRISLRDLEDMKEFVEDLKISIGDIIKKFQTKEKKVVKT